MDIMDIAIAKALSGGGGGGTGGVDMFVVNVTATPTGDVGYNYATETAYADILAALEAGKIVVYWVTFNRDEYIDFEMSVSVSYSKSGDAIYLTLGSGIDYIHTADGFEEDG